MTPEEKHAERLLALALQEVATTTRAGKSLQNTEAAILLLRARRLFKAARGKPARG